MSLGSSGTSALSCPGPDRLPLERYLSLGGEVNTYQPVQENRKRQSGSAQTACEYAVRIQYLARGVYKVQEKGFTHNHEPFEGASAHPSGRRLTVGDQKNIGRLAVAGVGARQIKQFFKQQSAPNRPEPTKRVIYNVQGKIGQEMRKG